MKRGNSSNCVHWLYATRTGTFTSMDSSMLAMAALLHGIEYGCRVVGNFGASEWHRLGGNFMGTRAAVALLAFVVRRAGDGRRPATGQDRAAMVWAGGGEDHLGERQGHRDRSVLDEQPEDAAAVQEP